MKIMLCAVALTARPSNITAVSSNAISDQEWAVTAWTTATEVGNFYFCNKCCIFINCDLIAFNIYLDVRSATGKFFSAYL